MLVGTVVIGAGIESRHQNYSALTMLITYRMLYITFLQAPDGCPEVSKRKKERLVHSISQTVTALSVGELSLLLHLLPLFSLTFPYFSLVTYLGSFLLQYINYFIFLS
jgi:hypothetical protein